MDAFEPGQLTGRAHFLDHHRGALFAAEIADESLNIVDGKHGLAIEREVVEFAKIVFDPERQQVFQQVALRRLSAEIGITVLEVDRKFELVAVAAVE